MKCCRRLLLILALTGQLHGCAAVLVQGARHIYAALTPPEREVGVALDTLGRHLNAADIASVGELLAADAQWASASGRTQLNGKESILGHLRGCALDSKVSVELSPEQTTVRDDTLALQTGRIHQTWSAPDGTDRAREGRFDAEWSRTEQGRWLLRRWAVALNTSESAGVSGNPDCCFF